MNTRRQNQGGIHKKAPEPASDSEIQPTADQPVLQQVHNLHHLSQSKIFRHCIIEGSNALADKERLTSTSALLAKSGPSFSPSLEQHAEDDSIQHQNDHQQAIFPISARPVLPAANSPEGTQEQMMGSPQHESQGLEPTTQQRSRPTASLSSLHVDTNTREDTADDKAASLLTTPMVKMTELSKRSQYYDVYEAHQHQNRQRPSTSRQHDARDRGATQQVKASAASQSSAEQNALDYHPRSQSTTTVPPPTKEGWQPSPPPPLWMRHSQLVPSPLTYHRPCQQQNSRQRWTQQLYPAEQYFPSLVPLDSKMMDNSDSAFRSTPSPHLSVVGSPSYPSIQSPLIPSSSSEEPPPRIRRPSFQGDSSRSAPQFHAYSNSPRITQLQAEPELESIDSSSDSSNSKDRRMYQKATDRDGTHSSLSIDCMHYDLRQEQKHTVQHPPPARPAPSRPDDKSEECSTLVPLALRLEQTSMSASAANTEELFASTNGAHQSPLLPSIGCSPSTSSRTMVPDRAVGALPSSFSSSEPAGSMFTFASASAQARASPSFNVLSARGTPKGPLPIDVQLNLLTSVLKHDPFNCPIRQTSQVWERIGREQGIRARTCARRYENIIQANIAGRDRPVGTEEQMAAKEQLLEQLFVMMNQPQAIVRMQKKRRYRSEEADRKLLMETIRLNPFGQKIGQVAKAWEDVKDTLGMKVHARQCIRRVNRMVKPYQLRERMYNGNIPEEMKEENDDLVKQVMLLMQLGGHGGVLEDDAGPSNEDDSISDSDYQENSYMASELSKRNLIQESDELKGDHDKDMASPPASSSHAEITGVQSPLIQQSTPAASEPASMRSSGTTTPIKKSRSHTRNSSGLTDKKKSSNGAGGAEDSRAVRSVESEFRPQRIWGSHPYSRETLSRAALGPQLQRGRPNKKNEQRLSVNSAGDYQQPVKYTRSSVGGRVESFIEPDHDNQQILVQSPVSDASYHISLPSPLALSIASSSKSVHEAGPFPLDSASHLYQTLLNEFHVVKGYLSRLDGQRQRDKDNQRKMYSMVEKLQLHVTEQQRSIQDLQIQMQQSYQQRHSPNQPSTSSLQQDVSWTQQSYQQQQQYQLHRHHHECSPSAQIQPENPRSSERHHTVPSTRPLLPLWPDHEYGQGSNSRGDDDRSLQDRISAVSNVMYESQAGVKTTMISSENSDSE